jgi:hypothetical protein
MTMLVLRIYRESEFSPGKVDDDARILDAVLAELRTAGLNVSAIEPGKLRAAPRPAPDLVLAMCQGEHALRRLAQWEEAGAVTVNSALAIRNCYRDLLGAGLAQAGVPAPRGALVETAAAPRSWRLNGLDTSLGLYVKRGDLHALDTADVQRVAGLGELEAIVASFARRGVKRVYLQQEVPGPVIKFYGVSGGEYFAALAEGKALPDQAERRLRQFAEQAAAALGLEAWGGDAVLDGDGVMIIDFNDWPSFGRVRREAARAIARRCLMLLRRTRRNDRVAENTAMVRRHDYDDSQ